MSYRVLPCSVLISPRFVAMQLPPAKRTRGLTCKNAAPSRIGVDLQQAKGISVLCTDDDDVIPLQEALDELRIHRSTFYRYCNDGKLASFKHGGRTYVRRAWISDYRAKLMAAAAQAQSRKARSVRARRSS